MVEKADLEILRTEIQDQIDNLEKQIENLQTAVVRVNRGNVYATEMALKADLTKK